MEPIKLDLTQCSDNAYSILATFRKAAMRQGRKMEEIEKVINLAKSGNYDLLMRTITSFVH